MSEPQPSAQSSAAADGSGSAPAREANPAQMAGQSQGTSADTLEHELRASLGLTREQAAEATPGRSAPQAHPQPSSSSTSAAQAGDGPTMSSAAEGASAGLTTPGAAAGGTMSAESRSNATGKVPAAATAMKFTKHKGSMPAPPPALHPGLQDPMTMPVHWKAPGIPLLRTMAKSAMPKQVQPVWPKAATCSTSTAPSAFGRTARADGGSAPQISNRELIRGPLQNIPNFRLNELKRHLRDLLAAEDEVVPPPIVSVYCPPEERSEEHSEDTGRGNDATASSATTDNDGSSAKKDASEETAHGATWDCPACGETNRSTRSQCNNCGKVRPGESCPAAEGETDGAADTAADGQRGIKRKRQSMLISSAWREGARAAAELALKRKLEHAKEGDTLELYLRQINYTQDSIKMQFRDNRPVATMRHELVEGEKRIQDIPTISALVYEGRVYTVDNRRLWAFKNCGLPDDTRIPVMVARADHSFRLKFTTPTGGRTVRRRNDEGFAAPVNPWPANQSSVNPPGVQAKPVVVSPPGLNQANPPHVVPPPADKPEPVDPPAGKAEPVAEAP